jgi:chaperonin GroEL (HSP60 family)
MLLLPPSQLCRLVEIVRKALSWPARQIAINAGEDGSIIVGKILEKDQYAYGFDAQNGEYVNMLAKGVCRQNISDDLRLSLREYLAHRV